MRAMVELSRHYGKGPVSLTLIAQSATVPPAYLEQLIGPLRRAELVTSTRGAHGGYELARDPADIRVGEVYRVLEGPVAPMDCVSEVEPDEQCPLIEGCAIASAYMFFLSCRAPLFMTGLSLVGGGLP
jgi:Rrf2 family protein